MIWATLGVNGSCANRFSRWPWIFSSDLGARREPRQISGGPVAFWCVDVLSLWGYLRNGKFIASIKMVMTGGW